MNLLDLKKQKICTKHGAQHTGSNKRSRSIVFSLPGYICIEDSHNSIILIILNHSLGLRFETQLLISRVFDGLAYSIMALSCIKKAEKYV